MKRIFCLVLAIVVLSSVAAVCASANVTYGDKNLISVKEAVEAYEAQTGETCPTRRYYFQMPDGENGPQADNGKRCESWYNEFTQSAGIFWYGDLPITGNTSGWVGFLPERDSALNVYYADVPTFVKVITWNNCVDPGTDDTQPIFFSASQTLNIGCERYEPGETEVYPDGTDGFDNMIYVLDPNRLSVTGSSMNPTYGGEWYYYYGNGCYGTEKSDNYGFFDGSICENPDHQTTPEYIFGDADLDGKVTVMDATLMQMCCAKLTQFSHRQFLSGDVNRWGGIDILDVTDIQKYLAKIISAFCPFP